MNNVLKISELLTGYRKGKPVTSSPFTAEALPGQITGVIGRNGAGKTTLLKTICSILKPLSGNVFYNDENITAMHPLGRAKRISYVMTGSSMIPDISVADVVAMGRFPGTGWVRSLSETDRELCLKAIEKTEIQHLVSKQFQSISDGEKQRVLFAMALAQNTQVMLFDEPAAFLDIPAKYHIYRIMHDLSRNDGKTIIFSTHDISNAIVLCDKIWGFTGNSVECGPPELLGINNFYDKVFPGENLKFDPEKMDFVSASSEKSVPVDISGSGNRFRWTFSALKRLGFDPGCNISASVSVIINENDENWIIQFNNEKFSTASFTIFEEKMKCIIKNQTL